MIYDEDAVTTDTVPPTITPSSDKTFEATGLNTTLSIEEIVAPLISDDVDPNPILSNNITGPFAIGTTVIVWTATDSSNNTSTAIQTITVQDTTAPTITVPPNVSFNTTGTPLSLTQADYGIATAMDLVDISPEITSDAPPSFQVGNTTITWTATDDYQNSANAIQTVMVTTDTLIDTTPPGISSITRSDPTDSVTDIQTLVFNVAFSEAVTGADVGNFVLSPDSPLTSTTQTRSTDLAIPDGQTVQDVIQVSLSGTVSTLSVSVNITHAWIGDLKVELVSPDDTVRVLHNMTGGSDDNITEMYEPDFTGKPVTGNWTLRLTDTTTPDPGVLNSWMLAFGSNPITGVSGTGDSRLITVSAPQNGVYNLDVIPDGISDLADNPMSNASPTGADESYTVNATMPDTTPPTILVPPNVTAEAIGITAHVDIGNATAIDNVDPNPSLTNNATTSLFQLGDTTVTWTATDASNNTSTATQTITITDDIILPGISSITRNNPINSTTDSRTLVFNVMFSETVTGVGTDDFEMSTGSPTAGSTYTRRPALAIPDGQTVQDIMAVSGQGIVSTISASVDITHAWIGDLRVELVSPNGTARVLHDNIGGSDDNIVETYEPDFAGVPISGNWTLRITDITSPDPGTLNSWTLIFGSNPITDVSGTDDSRLVTVSASQSGTYNLNVVSGGISDLAGNSLSNTTATGADESYTVNMISSDVTPPTITAPVDVIVEATGLLTPVSLITVTVEDDFDPNPVISNNATSSFQLGNTTVVWTATDYSDNVSTAIQLVTVRDTTPPSFNPVPANITRTFASGVTTVVSFDTPTATDLVDADVDVSCTPQSGSIFQAGNTTTVSCTATDNLNNSVMADFTVSVTVEDVPLFPPEVLEAKATDSEVILTWYPPTTGSAIDYQVLRGTDSGLSVLVNNTQSTDIVFVDYLASPNTSYTYQIRAVTADGLSPLSNSVNVTTSPTGILDLRATSTNSTVTLTWNAVNSEALTGYVVDKTYGIDGIAGVSISFLGSNELTLNDTNVSTGDTFVYHIFADDGGGYRNYLYYDFIVVTVE